VNQYVPRWETEYAPGDLVLATWGGRGGGGPQVPTILLRKRGQPTGTWYAARWLPRQERWSKLNSVCVEERIVRRVTPGELAVPLPEWYNCDNPRAVEDLAMPKGSTKLQTALLGQAVRYITAADLGLDEPTFQSIHRNHGLAALAGQRATVASVYLDPDGSPKYTLRLASGELREEYASAFRLVEED